MGARLNSTEKRRVYRALERRQSNLCFYCDEPVVKPPPGERTVVELKEQRWGTIDHLRPLSRGGSNKLNNMVLACVGCHQARHGVGDGEEE
jgi:5-methylcytosine-specific restriction endonuclease McrA